MYNPHEVPLPYHTRVKSYTEQGEVTIEKFNELGQWMEQTVDRVHFEAMAGGTTVFYTEIDYEESLLICPGGNSGAPQCTGCPCLEAHYSWECGRSLNDEHCPDCEPIADELQSLNEQWFEESHLVVIQEKMPGVGYGDISPRTAAYATKELLKRGQPYLLFEKFGRILKNNFSGSQNTGKKIKFRRYGGGFKSEEKKVTG
jgi:hypothetical protein